MAVSKQQGFVSSLSLGSQEDYEYFCQPCNKERNLKEAEGYCENCREFLCFECYRIHRQPLALQHHLLLDKKNMTKHKPPTTAQDVITDRCLQHAGKLVEYFCSVHKTMACHACIILNHRNCDPVQFIPDVATDIYYGQEFKDLNKQLDAMIAKSQVVTRTSLQNSSSTDTIYSTAIQDLKLFRKQINAAIDQVRKDITKEAESVRQSDKTRMKILTDKSSETTAELQAIQSEIKHLQSVQKSGQLFVAIKKAKDHLDVLQATLHDLDNNTNITKYKFLPNQQILDVLKEPDGLGKLSHDISRTSQAASAEISQMTYVEIGQRAIAGNRQVAIGQGTKSKISTKNQAATCTSHVTPTQVTHGPVLKDPKQLKATFVTDINVKSASDKKNCNITGATLVGDIMVICDHKNCKVKLMDTQRQAITSEVEVSSNPWTVAEVDHNQIAVTLPETQKIAFLQLTDKLKLKKEMTVNGRCNGIVYTNDMLVVTFKGPGKFELLDMQGNVLYKIDRDSRGNQLFSDPFFVDVAPGGQLLYISDWSNHTVTCVTVDGEVKGVYKDSGLQYPGQLAVDTNGTVIVCGYSSDNILVLNSQCEKVKVLLSISDGLMFPQALCYNQETGMLCVGRFNNNMKMYKLS